MSIYYCDPPFHPDPGYNPATSPPAVWLVVNLNARFPGPGNYTSWESCNAVTTGVTGGPGRKYQSVAASLPAWRACCRRGLHAHLPEPDFDSLPPVYSEIPTVLPPLQNPSHRANAEEEGNLLYGPLLPTSPASPAGNQSSTLFTMGDHALAARDLAAVDRAEDAEEARALTTRLVQQLSIMDGPNDSLQHPGHPQELATTRVALDVDPDTAAESERIAASFGLTLAQLATRGLEWSVLRSGRRSPLADFTPASLRQYEELRLREDCEEQEQEQGVAELSSQLKYVANLVQYELSLVALGAQDQHSHIHLQPEPAECIDDPIWDEFESDQDWDSSFSSIYSDTTTGPSNP